MNGFISIESPVGKLWIAADDDAILSLRPETEWNPSSSVVRCESPLLHRAKIELEEYFAGERSEFDLPLRPKGTPFQQRVWEALRTIPYGQTRSYQEIAIQIGNPMACRAVGMANNRNPISLLIPCHRVIGKTGKLVGYGGGLAMKAALLALEQQGIK